MQLNSANNPNNTFTFDGQCYIQICNQYICHFGHLGQLKITLSLGICCFLFAMMLGGGRLGLPLVKVWKPWYFEFCALFTTKSKEDFKRLCLVCLGLLGRLGLDCLLEIWHFQATTEKGGAGGGVNYPFRSSLPALGNNHTFGG